MSCHHTNIVLGGLNLPKIDWTSLTSSEDVIHRQFLSFVIEAGLVQFVNFCTRELSILDVVLSNDDQIMNYIAGDPPIGNSDHCIIKFLLSIEHDGHYNSTNIIETANAYNWHRADFDAIGRYLDCIDWHSLVCYNPLALDTWNAFIALLRHAIDLYVPLSTASLKTARREKLRKMQSKQMRIFERKKRQLRRKIKCFPYNAPYSA
jgi:hypothetical protein